MEVVQKILTETAICLMLCMKKVLKIKTQWKRGEKQGKGAENAQK